MSLFKALEYSKHSYPQRYSTFKYLAENFRLIDSLPFPVNVLDIGCGTGENTRLLTYFNNVQHVAAFDIDKEMVAYADCFNGDKKIQYAVADAQNVSTWPKPNENQFDLVTSFHVLHWAKDQERVLENILSSLRAEGVFVARLLGKMDDSDLLEFVAKSEKWGKYSISWPMCVQPWMEVEDPAKAYEKLLSKVGFQVSNCKNTVDKIRMSVEDGLEYLKSMRFHRFNVPKDKFEEFCTDCFETCFRNQCNDDDNTFSMIYNVIDVVAYR